MPGFSPTRRRRADSPNLPRIRRSGRVAKTNQLLNSRDRRQHRRPPEAIEYGEPGPGKGGRRGRSSSSWQLGGRRIIGTGQPAIHAAVRQSVDREMILNRRRRPTARRQARGHRPDRCAQRRPGEHHDGADCSTATRGSTPCESRPSRARIHITPALLHLKRHSEFPPEITAEAAATSNSNLCSVDLILLQADGRQTARHSRWSARCARPHSKPITGQWSSWGAAALALY